jgi:hypothetical protein
MSYLCYCGNVIKDNIYPCPEAGDLKWQPQAERASQNSFESVEEFLTAFENGKGDDWIKGFFNESYPKVDIATAISDIFSRHVQAEGHSVYKCSECERIYIQKEYQSDEYDCFEKRLDYAR